MSLDTPLAPIPYRNLLLASLEERQLGRLRPGLEAVDLPLGMVLESPGKVIAHVYFPDAGICTVVVLGLSGRRGEVGLLGREGMSGLEVMLGDEPSRREIVVQLAGHGHRIRPEVFRDATRKQPMVHVVFLRFMSAALSQVANAGLATARLNLEERLARWLLMCHDRVDGDDLGLTQGFLSLMLGVERAGVTAAVHLLEGRSLIRTTRDSIRITDRAGLERATWGVYGVAEAEYVRLVGPRAGKPTLRMN